MMYLPDTMANWPSLRNINPHYEEVSAQCNEWIRRFQTLTESSRYAIEKVDASRLAALAFPRASQDHVRSGCDLMAILFLIDEYTDFEPAPVVRQIVDVIIDALNNPHKPRPHGEVVLGQITKEFWEKTIVIASPVSQQRFVRMFIDELNAVAVEAQDRADGFNHTIESYLKMRQDHIGIPLIFAFGMIHLSIPDEVLDHPIIKEMHGLIAEITILDHDMFSYNKEQAAGDDLYNILTVSMRELNTDLDGAVKWACKRHAKVEERYLTLVKKVPCFGTDIDEELDEYVEFLTNWPRANSCWSFECSRYFGKRGLQIQKTRLVTMLPRVQRDIDLKADLAVTPPMIL